MQLRVTKVLWSQRFQLAKIPVHLQCNFLLPILLLYSFMLCYHFFSPAINVTKLQKHRIDKILHYFCLFLLHPCLDYLNNSQSVSPANKFSIDFQKYPISCPFQEILCFFLLFWNAELILLLLEGAHGYCSQPWRCWTVLAGSAELAPISSHGITISDLWVFSKNQLSPALDSHQWKQSTWHSSAEHLKCKYSSSLLNTLHICSTINILEDFFKLFLKPFFFYCYKDQKQQPLSSWLPKMPLLSDQQPW